MDGDTGDSVEALLAKECELFDQKRFDEALEAAERARSLDATLAAAWTVTGQAYLGLKRTSEAFDACQRALSLDSDDVTAQIGVAVLLASQKHYRQALKGFARLLRLAIRYRHLGLSTSV